MNADPAELLTEAGADRRALGATLLSIQNREGHSALRTFSYECGHTHQTALLSPPQYCPACKLKRFEQEKALAPAHRIRVLNARSAVERAKCAHTRGKPHMICHLCVVSRSVDAKALTEAHAGMFSPRQVRGFRE